MSKVYVFSPPAAGSASLATIYANADGCALSIPWSADVPALASLGAWETSSGSASGGYNFTNFDAAINAQIGYGAASVVVILAPIAFGGSNNFTPNYVFTSGWATAISSPTGRLFTGADSSYDGAGTISSGTCAQGVDNTAFPVAFQSPFVTAWKAAVTAAVNHIAAASYASKIAYIRIGGGAGGEWLPYATSALETQCSPANSAGLAIAWAGYMATIERQVFSLASGLKFVQSTNGGLAAPFGLPYSLADTEAALAIGYGFGIGNQGLQNNDISVYASVGNASGGSNNSGYSSNDFLYTFSLNGPPIRECQTYAASDPTYSGTPPRGTMGSLVPLLPFAGARGVDHFELYYLDWQVAYDATNANYATYHVAYQAALISARGLVLTTTLAAYLGHNTSANPFYTASTYPAGFTGTTWVDTAGDTLAVNSALSDDNWNSVTPCHVSPLSIKTRIMGFPGPWFAHVVPWFGTGSSTAAANHMDIGLDSDTTLWVTASTTDQQRRGFDGIIIDWYGPGRYEDSVTLLLQSAVAAMQGFTFAIMIDQGGYATTAGLQTQVAYVMSQYAGTTNYWTVGGLPVILFFGTVAGVNYATVKAAYPNAYWIMQGPGALANSYVDGCFDWVQAYGSGVPPSDPYNASAANGFLSSVHSSAKGSIPCFCPGFDGYNTRIKEGAYKQGYILPRDSGKCWLSQAAVVAANLPTNIIGMQLPTWDDWEEGTALETAIDNGLTVSTSIAGTILSWSVTGGTGDESTLSLYTILASINGATAAVLDTRFPSGSHSLDLSTILGWGSTTYTLYVVAQGVACVGSKVSPGISYRAASGGTAHLRDSQDVLIFEVKSPAGHLRDSQDVLIFEVPPPSTGHLHDSQDVLIFEVPTLPVAFAYPITLPTTFGPKEFSLSLENVVGESDSPFDFSDQVFLWPGDMFTAEVLWPPMLAAQAEPFISALAMLLGKYGTFLLPDYNRLSPQGAMTGAPLVNGINASGSNQLHVRGAALSVANWAVAGDYIQVTAAGGLQRMHKVLQNASTDGSGATTLQIRPGIRETLADGVAIVTSNCAGTFRLSSNTLPWKIDQNHVYTVFFKAREAGLP